MKWILLPSMLGVSIIADAQSIDSSVTQDNIKTTVCVPGYSAKVRPSYSYTHRIKLAKLKVAGISEYDAALYELDHIIPLSLGGSPKDLKNLQIQFWTAAKKKDTKESAYHKLVCSETITLKEAQDYFFLYKDVANAKAN